MKAEWSSRFAATLFFVAAVIPCSALASQSSPSPSISPFVSSSPSPLPSPSPSPSLSPIPTPSPSFAPGEEPLEDTLIGMPDEVFEKAKIDVYEYRRKVWKEHKERIEKTAPAPLLRQLKELDQRIKLLDELPGQLIESINGADAIEITYPDGKRIKLEQGLFMKEDSLLRTPPGVCVTVAFEDLSEVMIAGGSEVSMRIDPEGEVGVPLVLLKAGVVRVMVSKSRKNDDEEDEEDDQEVDLTAPLRFKVRTEALAVGAKGTDFIVSVKDNQTTAHVVSGKIVYAKGEADLMTEKAGSVSAEMSVRSERGKPEILKPEKVKSYKVIARLYDLHPGMKTLRQNTLKPHRSGILLRYDEIRKVREEQKRVLEKKRYALAKKYYPIFRGPEADKRARRLVKEKKAKFLQKVEDWKKSKASQVRRQKRFTPGEADISQD